MGIEVMNPITNQGRFGGKSAERKSRSFDICREFVKIRAQGDLDVIEDLSGRFTKMLV
jgi:hypothetical protein